jgi:uncharacterized repeat protein (TIGR01451 family)
MAFILGITTSGGQPATAAADSRPDLTVTAINISPQGPAIDDTVTITVTVKNQGTADAAASQVVCYIDSAILATESISGLSPGAMATATFTWQAQSGSHVIKATADSAGFIPETDENNNTMSLSLTTLAPDLTVQSISWSPSNPSNGDNIIFTVTIRNQGNSRARSTKVNLYIDGISHGYRDVAAIDPNTTATTSHNWIARSGQHNIKAVVDDNYLVTESNETNNEYTCTFSTLPPDLIVENITWSPENPSKNDTVTFKAAIKNQGTGWSDSCQMAYYIDGSFQSLLPVEAIGPGTSENITFTYSATLDLHEIKVIIDYNNTVPESDDTNNEKASSFLTLRPDLFVEDFTWEPDDIGVGDVVIFTATIKNKGAGKAGAFRVACYVGGYFAGSLVIPQLAADDDTTISFDWQASNGTHIVSIIADCDSEITESDENNNTVTKNIPIILPDIWIPSIDWSPKNPSIGDLVTFSVNLTNMGGGRADGFIVAYYLDGSFLASAPISGIPSESSINATFTWKAQNGRHAFRVFADYNQAIPEINENNNEKTVTVIPLMPDLDIGTITWSPADMLPGSEVTFCIEIKNTGTLSAGHSRVAYYIDGSITGFTDIDGLNAGSVFTDRFLWVVAPGSHTIEIVADSSAQVTEIDEDNNIKAVSVPLPDLTIPDIIWSPLQASIGDNVTFTATVKNQGGSRTQTSLLTCYIDGFLVGSQDLPPIEPAGSTTGSFVWVAGEGRHDVRIVADSVNRITEIDETNNEMKTTFSTMTSDLVIQDIGWLIENPMVNDDVILTVTINNQGSDIAADSQLACTIDDSPPVLKDVGILPAGGSSILTITSALKAGPHTVRLAVDYLDEVIELDETNNDKAITFTTVAPDLVIKTISWSPRDAVAGDSVTISVKIENQGIEKATQTRLALIVNGTPVVYAEIGDIDVGAMVTKEFTWTAVAGLQEIGACADIDGLLLESNEVNNLKSRSITIADKALAEAPVNLAAGLPADKGFLSSFWWLILLISALFGAAAFVSAYKAFKKEK